MMYSELVKSLRNDSGECGVLGKVKWGADFKRAADAIEELNAALGYGGAFEIAVPKEET